MHQIIKIIHFVWAVGLMFSCNSHGSIDNTNQTNKILQMHNAQRDFHFNKDSIAFANQLSDNFISVNKGIISKPSKEETISRYHRYFSSVEFIQWDDVSPPIIKFSEDGKTAYTIVDKIVEVSYLLDNGLIDTSMTHFAWTAIYKLYGEEWKIDCVTSTNKLSN